ncbi:hypothetical protein B1987_12370 [Mycobacterium kansasii]|uniref:Uncharacterized protein n=1 Tax=Mycobacterium attenuatum TaxID=2341086 RepID=A0A498QG32_9MYCO|nr:SIR2 family protein [Mycobacterium attenuatum]ORB84460.1 hypothetical protein B1987_12370 [Mycobacterium kansasii]VBA43455.1 hypothetical protein LAUMK136_05094 [Mycobacterium attenuatum]
MAELAPTAAARQGLLARFFEPSDEERQQNLKVPSKAHQALAQLVKRGLVRVILTTNFDRLTEQALEAAGIAPQVIARPEAVAGMAPLAHTPATVVKLHGDYKDLGSRNTAEELGTYPDEWNALLRQVTDEYGLLVCGWSADWDTALVSAIESAPGRRYPLYWDSRSSRGESAKRLLTARAGVVVEAPSADELFGDLLSSIEALESLTEPALTTAMAVARLKRCLHDPTRKIELHDLVVLYVDKVSDSAKSQPTHMAQPDGQALQDIFDGYRSATSPLLHLLVTGVWHDSDGVHDRLWLDVLERLTTMRTPIDNAYHDYLDRARLYPALLAATAIGVTAVARGRESLAFRLLNEVAVRDWTRGREPLPLAQALHVNHILNKAIIDSFPRWGENFPGWIFPESHLLKADLRDAFRDYIPNDDAYKEHFHSYEYRVGLTQEKTQNVNGAYRAAPGEYVGERAWTYDDDRQPLVEIAFRKSRELAAEWPWESLFGGDPEAELLAYREVLKRYASRW